MIQIWLFVSFTKFKLNTLRIFNKDKVGIWKSQHEHSKVNYADLENGLTGNPYKWKRVLDSKVFQKHKFWKYVVDWVRWFGIEEPIIIENPDGLDMEMLHKDITVSEIAEAVGMFIGWFKNI